LIAARIRAAASAPTSLALAASAAAAMALASAGASAAPVDPNPLSLLKDKRILVINGNNEPEYHKGPRDIMTGKLAKMKAAVGIATLKVVGNADTMSFATLDQYDVIFFNYFTRAEYFMGKPFEKGFRQWVAKGNRGIVGNHNTGAKTKGEWDWFRDSVTSMWYMDHKDGSQPGTIHATTDPVLSKLPVLDKLDKTFTGSDEWYSFDMKPWHAVESPTWKDCKVLYTLDEKSVAHLTDAMGAYHPVAWIREDALRNRFFYTTLIHSDNGANSDFYHSLILRALEYVSGYQEPMALDGAALDRPEAPVFAASGRRVDVDVTGDFALSVWSAAGKRLYAVSGNGKRSYAPAALAEPGLYLLRLESKAGTVSRRVMMY
jgi:type 1 glutamine amidotransferase